MSAVASPAPLRLRIDFPAFTLGGVLLAQQLRPVAEPLFAEPARLEGGRHVWVVELPDGVGLGATVAGQEVMIRAERGRVALVLPVVVAAVVVAKLREGGVAVENWREAAGSVVCLEVRGRREVVVPAVGRLGLGSL